MAEKRESMRNKIQGEAFGAPIISSKMLDVKLNVAFPASSPCQTPRESFVFPRQPGDLIFEPRDLGARIFELLREANNSQAGVFELVELIVDTFVRNVEFLLQTMDLSDERGDGGVVRRIV